MYGKRDDGVTEGSENKRSRVGEKKNGQRLFMNRGSSSIYSACEKLKKRKRKKREKSKER